MLADFIENQEELLDQLQKGWQSLGATSFTLNQPDGQLLYGCLPDTGDPGEIASQLRVGKLVIGEIKVTGLPAEVYQERLHADAAMLAQLWNYEQDVADMTFELVSKQDQILALYELSRLMHTRLTISETLHTLTSSAARLLGSTGAIAFYSDTGQQAFSQYPHIYIGDEEAHSLLENLIYNNNLLVLNDNKTINFSNPEIENLLLVVIPLPAPRKAMLGFINKKGRFNSPDVKLAKAVAQQGGSQLETVLLHQEILAQSRYKAEMDLAASIQARLLPQFTPQVEGLEIFGHSQAAFEVGGDFYDFMVLPNKSFQFLLGDVSGKGMSAALLMTMTKAILHNAARFSPTPEPAEILERVNSDLYDDFSEIGMFATVFFGQYYPLEHKLTYANAGHSPVYYCPAGGRPRLLEADGTAVGVIPLSFCENQSIDFRPDDVLVIMSDGFSEASNAAGEMFGYERLENFIQEIAGLTAPEIGWQLLAEVRAFSEKRPQDDDQTLVVLKCVA